MTEVVVDRDGAEERYAGDIVVLACGAANTAKLLFLSANDRHPNGLANGSDQVGRNYMFHNSQAVLALSREENPTTYQKTLGLNDFYFASDEEDFPLGNIQMVGKSQAPMFKGEKPIETKLAPGWSLERVAKHAIDFWLSTEDLPRAENRVTVDRDGKVTLAYTATNDVPKDKLYHKLKSLLGMLDLNPDHLVSRFAYLKNDIPVAGCAHQAGTCRFGDDPADSVLNRDCRAHELDNLYVVDTSIFPSIGAVNPALTAMANSIRVGDHLLERMLADPTRQAADASGGELALEPHEQRLERELRREVELLELPPRLAHGLGGALGAEHPLARRVARAGRRAGRRGRRRARRRPRRRRGRGTTPRAPRAGRAAPRARRRAARASRAARPRAPAARGPRPSPPRAPSPARRHLLRAREQRASRRRRARTPSRVDGARLREQRRAALGGVAVEQPLEPVEPAGRDARERGALLLVELGRARRDRVAHRALRQPPERHELAARADRLGDRPEVVGDEHDHRVRRRLLEVLEQRVGRVVVHQVGAEDQVDAPVGLERPHVQVAPQLADRVDADHLAERLELVDVGVHRRASCRRARARTRGRAARLPTPCGPWKRYACAGPSSSAASSSRFASCCSGTRSNLLTPGSASHATRARDARARRPAARRRARRSAPGDAATSSR